MALNDLQLSLMTFPQRWDGAAGTLTVNLLLLPVGDPTAPLGTGPAFAGTTIDLRLMLASGLDALPSTSSVITLDQPSLAVPAPVAPALFAKLLAQLTAKGITVTSGKLAVAPAATARIQKALPDTYKAAFAFERRRSDDIVEGDGFGCAVRAQAPQQINPTLPKPDQEIAWGQVLSYALRQPVLAQALGLIYPITLNVAPELVTDGGYLWATLDTSNATNPWVADFTSNADTVKSYAARIPPLDTSQRRPVFAARLFPVVAPPTDPRLAQSQLEAEEYDDGFAQIVHVHQPSTIDTATLDPNQIAPGTEPGIQLGWDDEQATIWLNSQVDLLRDRVAATTNTAESPLGVQGYRVDVREKGTATWSSLCVVNGTLPFDNQTVGGAASTAISGNEFWIAPAPIRTGANDNKTNAEAAWLPLYFSQWAGASLVLPDPVVQLLAFATSVKNPPQPLPPAVLPNPNPDLTAVPALRYGHQYEFRVRLTDLTGGGPASTDKALHPGPAPISQTRLLRHVPPKALEIEVDPPEPPLPAKPSPTRAIASLSVRRPRINYPEAVFAGVAASTFARPGLDALIKDAWASGRTIAVPDPDVDRFEVRVEARVPANDTGDAGSAPGDLDDSFRVIYTVEVPFPAGADPTVTLSLDYTDGIDDIATMSPPSSGTVTLPIPTARDIRLRLFPKGAAKPDYYGNDAAMLGLPSDYVVRQDATDEDQLFPNTPELQLQAFFFQPGADIVQRLAQQLNLKSDGLQLSAPGGERAVFGGSGHIRHSVSADGSVFAFANPSELLGQWIVALVLDLQRDWTWDGFATAAAGPALRFDRDGANVGAVTWARVVAASAVTTPGVAPDRSHTRVVFLDAFNPQPVAPAFPREATLHYAVTATFAAAAAQQYPLAIRLPITTPPAQTPKIVSTGIAESSYLHAADYSETSPRERYLWIEFDQPLLDKDDDSYFARVLAYGPDPLLAASLLPRPDPAQMLPERIEPPLPIDPEPVRRIFSGQSADQSGLDAMTQLVPAQPIGLGASGRFFLLPLPPNTGPEELSLFGFWTYEFRVGHATMWSTAQGRYGRPLRVSGLQHPAPHLVCSVERAHQGVGVTAPYAITVDNGNRLYDFRNGDPQTAMWFMLYTQVLQADGASYRNILLNHRLGHTLHGTKQNPQHGSNFGPLARTVFDEKEIEARLDRLALPKTAPLSVLAVEVLPGALNVVGRAAGGDIASDSPPSAREDPLQTGLGTRRILRTSPLTVVPASC